MAKMKTLEINYNRLTTGDMYKNGRYCSVGLYARKIKGLPVSEVESFRTYSDAHATILNNIMSINDDKTLTWKAKAKEITKLFKKMGVRAIWKNAPWK